MSNHLAQIKLVDPDGQGEVIWGQRDKDGSYVVLNVPVLVYGVSLGARVRCHDSNDGILRFERVIAESQGGTVRVILPRGLLASDWYLNAFLPSASVRNLGISPATFFDPRMVAIHVRRRASVWQEVGVFLSSLEKQSRIQQWVAVDPEKDQDILTVDRTLRGDEFPATEVVLTHPAPIESGLYAFGIDDDSLN